MRYIAQNHKGLSNTVARTFFSGIAVLFFTFSSMAQTNAATSATENKNLFSNPLFFTLVGTIIFLLIVIISLKKIHKSTFEYLIQKENYGKAKAITLLVLMLLGSFSSFGQDVTSTAQNVSSNTVNFNALTFILAIIALIEAFVVIILAFSLKNSASNFKAQGTASEEIKTEESSLLERINSSVAVEKEEDILLDHNYDGIRELDNDLPPWWKYGFYITILFAFIYLMRYHVLKTGDLQIEEYNKEVKQAESKMEEYRKKSATFVDETNAEMLRDDASISKGKEMFITSCSPCHGKLGQGTVGPNLTDDYWIHGGSIKDIFKTIKYGYPEKGMKAWETDFSPVQINQLASFVKSLAGTNPPEAKEKQGTLYTEDAEGTNAPNSVINDSSKVELLNADSMMNK